MEIGATELIKELFREDWPQIDRFIASTWGVRHPLRNRELFIWQHSGPSVSSEAAIATAIVVDQKIVGLRGLQYLSFQVYDELHRLHSINGCAAPFIHVLEEHRGLPSLKLYRHNLSRFPITLFLGANKSTSLRLHQASGYQIFGDLPRYGVKLKSHGVENRYDALDQKVEPELLGKIWSQFSSAYRPFAVLRTPDFFRWRYQEAPFWDYRMLLSKNRGAIAVYRIEPVVFKGNTVGAAFRIIELFHDPELCKDAQLREFVGQIMIFARAKGCGYVDHFQTMNVLQTALIDSGFLLIQPESRHFPVLFNPLDYAKPPINYGWKLSTALNEAMADASHSHYIVKSDSDQDRPTPPNDYFSEQ